MAEGARGEAEKLVVYLLDDFYLELEPVGRLDIVAELSKRAIDYYDALPPELRTAETNRNRALALVRYGAVLRNQSKLDESAKALSEAVGMLGKLQRDGDKSEATAIGLGMGLASQARLADSLAKRSESRQLAQQALEALKPLMAAPNPSVPLRRAFGGALLYAGFSQLRNNEEEGAVKNLEDAREAYRSIDGLKLGDLPSAAAYAEASAWEVNALLSLGRTDEARRVGEDAARVAGQVLEKRPGHMLALRARGLIGGSLAQAEWNDLHLRKALAFAEQAGRDWGAIVKLDPSNQIAWHNLADERSSAAFFLWSLGQIRESEQQWRASLAVEPYVKASGMIGGRLALVAGYRAIFEAEQGRRQAAEAALADNRRFTEMAIRDLPPDSFGRSFVPEFLGWYGFPATGVGYGPYALPLAAGDYETVRSLARASARRIEQLKPPGPEQELDKNWMLQAAYRTLAEASYGLKDYAAADVEIKRAVEIGRALPKRTRGEQRDASEQLMLAAMIAARLERYAEAQQVIEPVLRFHRELYARGRDNDDLTQHVEFAQALYVSALAAPGQKTAQLTQAAAILDGLPPEMRRQARNTLWRERIAEEQKRRRQ
jgi:tetratricopeptide (TPR) repeat protein